MIGWDKKIARQTIPEAATLKGLINFTPFHISLSKFLLTVSSTTLPQKGTQNKSVAELAEGQNYQD